MISGSYDPFRYQSPYFTSRRQREIALRHAMMEADVRRRSEYERRKRSMQEEIAREEQQRRRQQEIVQCQIMMEKELRRQSEYERRQRMQEEMAREEQLRHHGMMEVESTRKAEYERRRRAELHRRQEREMLQRERSTKKEEMAQSRENIYSHPPGTVVRGPDGNLYRVVTPPRYEQDDIKKSGTYTQYDQNSTRFDENKVTGAVKDKLETMNNKSDGSPECKDFDDDCKMKNHPQETIDAVLPVQNDAPQHEILVENVDDEEDEELRELRSVWRNRIPSPGQWIEPVETFRE